MLNFEKIKNNGEIAEYIRAGDSVLGEMGYTEHGPAHAAIVADTAEKILKKLSYDERSCSLAKIAGYAHDIGNIVNRSDHAQSGALMMFEILKRYSCSTEDTIEIVKAIGHHDEKTAAVVSPVAAALIIADKSDVRRSRVRNADTLKEDIHDRVNYAVCKSDLSVFLAEKRIVLALKIDTGICAVMEYFEIFLDRMVLCKKSAEYLGCGFELVINETRLL